MNPNLKRMSKFLSFVLRHKPEAIELSLDAQGWVNTNELIQQANKHNKLLTLTLLEQVVTENDKKRFVFNADKSKIRANQGHSIQVDLGYEAVQPPSVLYHGTATRFLESIRQTGLNKGSRHHVHLSKDQKTAKNVGARHGKVIVLTIDTEAMFGDGYTFFVSENGVWLTDQVPIKYINFTKV